MRIPLLTLLFLFNATLVLAGEPSHTHEKTLFIYPLSLGDYADELEQSDLEWLSAEFFKVFVKDSPRFDYIALADSCNLDSLIVDPIRTLEQDKVPLKWVREEGNGHVGSVAKTLADVRKDQGETFLFVPVIEEADVETDTAIWLNLRMAIHIYPVDGSGKVLTVIGKQTINKGKNVSRSLLSSIFSSLFGGGSKWEVEKKDIRDLYRETRKNLEKQPEFVLRSEAFNVSSDAFSIRVGSLYGVKVDQQFKAWKLDDEGNRVKMLAWGKVRRVKENTSRVQVLIGNVHEKDAVFHYVVQGMGVAVYLHALPIEVVGFSTLKNEVLPLLIPSGKSIDLPSDFRGQRLNVGIDFEYNTQPWFNASELYLTGRIGGLGVQGINLLRATVGVKKKYYLKRIGFWTSVEAGMIGASVNDSTLFDFSGVDKGSSLLVGRAEVNAGMEVLVAPFMSLQAEVGYGFAPEMKVVEARDPRDGETAIGRIRSAGGYYGINFNFMF